MTVFAIDYKKNKLRAFKSEKAARSMGEVVLFTSVDELLENRNTTNRGIVAVYNNCSDVAVKRFSDTRTGAARLFKLAQDIHVESTPFDGAVEEPKVVRTYKLKRPFSRENMGMDVAKVVKADAKQPRGKYAGKTIECLTMNRVVKNPRRENTHGFNSMGIIINAGGSVSYEEYIAQGGRPNDLAYDIEKGHVELV
jgi:hypothetical protein